MHERAFNAPLTVGPYFSHRNIGVTGVKEVGDLPRYRYPGPTQVTNVLLVPQ